MGGLILVSGFGAALMLALGLDTFFPSTLAINYVHVLAVLCTVLLTTLIGVVDDLMGIRQWVKALLPVIASLPLVAVQIGRTWMDLPLIGRVEFGVLYPLILVPLGITGGANALNMLAGFNGLELGMGLMAMGSLAVVAATVGRPTALVLLLSGCGAILGTLPFNWYPAKVFIGDVGTLSMGAIIAASAMIGGFQAAGVIVIIPHMIDFLFKAATGFQKSFGQPGDDGKLHCPQRVPHGLAQAIMKLTGGVRERTLTLILIGIEAAFGALAIGLYGRF